VIDVSFDLFLAWVAMLAAWEVTLYLSQRMFLCAFAE
jgi:hypothetical protein